MADWNPWDAAIKGQEYALAPQRANLQQAIGLQGILANQMKIQEQQQLQGILSSQMPDDQKLAALARGAGGSAGVDLAHKWATVQGQMQTMEQQKMLMGAGPDLMSNPDTLRRIGVLTKRPEFITHAERLEGRSNDSAALAGMRSYGGQAPSVAGTAPPDELGGGPVSPGTLGIPARQGLFDYLKSDKYVGPAAAQYQSAIDAGAPGMTPQQIYAHLDRLQQQATTQAGQNQRQNTTIINRPERAERVEPPVQTYTDGAGVLWERERSGSWVKAQMGQGAPAMTPKVPRDSRAEQMYKDYVGLPEVKAANDLERKIQPLVDYMIDFKKTGKSINTNDDALAKMYLAVTKVGPNAYNMDKKALAALPNLGDRLGNAATSFFGGKDLTDQIRTEMFNYIVSNYKELDKARSAHKTLIERRARAGGVNPDLIFGKSE